MRKKPGYKSDTILGDRYRDPQTGMEGVAGSVTFYQHACERVTLEFLKDGEVKYQAFDAPRLVHIDSGASLTQRKTGGPGGLEALPNRTADPR